MFIPLLAGTVLFRPIILTLSQGQLSGIVLCLLASLILVWGRGKWFWGSLLLGLLVLQPNLGFLIIALLVARFFLHRNWNILVGRTASCLLLLLAGFAYLLDWITEY